MGTRGKRSRNVGGRKKRDPSFPVCAGASYASKESSNIRHPSDRRPPLGSRRRGLLVGQSRIFPSFLFAQRGGRQGRSQVADPRGMCGVSVGGGRIEGGSEIIPACTAHAGQSVSALSVLFPRRASRRSLSAQPSRAQQFFFRLRRPRTDRPTDGIQIKTADDVIGPTTTRGLAASRATNFRTTAATAISDHHDFFFHGFPAGKERPKVSALSVFSFFGFFGFLWLRCITD